ncbi:murein DD-endopeptidase MepM [Phocoenobacter uteri]|nr:murein DD-endopeptidase MepM [Phocoenobacter uteri]MDG6881154.1 hypothetical protein [Phocoenobacter uteri]
MDDFSVDDISDDSTNIEIDKSDTAEKENAVEKEEANDIKESGENQDDTVEKKPEIIPKQDNEDLHINDQFNHIVTQNDTLKTIFEHQGLDPEIAQKLLQDFPDLAHLKAGQQFYWVTNNDGDIEYMDWLVSYREEQVFQLVAQDKFKREVLVKKGIWKEKVLKGKVSGNLSSSLQKLGLSSRQVYQLVQGLKPQLSLKHLRNGDKIEVLANCEFIDDKLVTLGKVEALRLIRGKEVYYSILADNGHYYGENGAVINKSQFSRYPLRFRPRISSHFNLHRRHPITRRVRPHKGVDFGLKIGTLVIAPADGVVTRVAYQRNGAGKYIKIKHGSKYETVYMHLSRSLVKIGQKVKKGQHIAYSGNTGRSTGPHLHYEFHINGRAVNPMTVHLPGIASHSVMSNKERKAYLTKVKKVIAKFK